MGERRCDDRHECAMAAFFGDIAASLGCACGGSRRGPVSAEEDGFFGRPDVDKGEFSGCVDVVY